MQLLAVISRDKMDGHLYKDGRHLNLTTKFKKQSDGPMGSQPIPLAGVVRTPSA